ncbi:MAG: histidine--tRNA ligase [Bacteroidales bacterium]|nr:histidine--tRNA ligase [Bacteroidales bacterium]
MAQKPSIPKGTRDFLPAEVVRRNYIFNTIKEVFMLFGFQAIETPAMEDLSTLLGKYGEEGDKLLYKILNSGNYLSKVSDETLLSKDLNYITPKISGKGLRYDLTVPFARFVVQNQNEIVFPFRRYQIQPVWRADRPQKGRYREFFQCDADIIGSNSMLNEAELAQIISEVFNRLKIDVILKVNNRKILAGIAEIIGEKERITDITVSLDKIEKIGSDAVVRELTEKGISDNAIDKLKPVLLLKGTNESKLGSLGKMLQTSETGLKGLQEIKEFFSYINMTNLKIDIELDLTLARGLNYYTGAIFEVKAAGADFGSICGGGRYDDLTGIFGMPGVSGVGISFGAERIYDVLLQLQLFPEDSSEITRVIFVNFGEKEEAYCLPILSKVREKGINAEIYPDSARVKKQMNYANKKQIPFVVLAGESEIASNSVTLKNMQTGEQLTVSSEELADTLLNYKAGSN